MAVFCYVLFVCTFILSFGAWCSEGKEGEIREAKLARPVRGGTVWGVFGRDVNCLPVEAETHAHTNEITGISNLFPSREAFTASPRKRGF